MIAEILILGIGLTLGALLHAACSKTKLSIQHGDWTIFKWNSLCDNDKYCIYAKNKEDEKLIIDFYKNGDIDVYCYGDIKQENI